MFVYLLHDLISNLCSLYVLRGSINLQLTRITKKQIYFIFLAYLNGKPASFCGDILIFFCWENSLELFFRAGEIKIMAKENYGVVFEVELVCCLDRRVAAALTSPSCYHVGFHAVNQIGELTLPVTTLEQFPDLEKFTLHFYNAEGRKKVVRNETWQMRLLNPEEKCTWQLYTISVSTCPVS